MAIRRIRETLASMRKRHHGPNMGNAPHVRRRAWQGSLGVVIMAIAVMLVAGSAVGVSGAWQAASPEASPAASPVASPEALADVPTTQIIVGKITIEMTSSGFRPTYFESAVGRDITITVVNDDSEPHNFTIAALDIDVDVAPGESETVQIDLPQLGRYEFYSDLPGDEDMQGAFSVFI